MASKNTVRGVRCPPPLTTDSPPAPRAVPTLQHRPTKIYSALPDYRLTYKRFPPNSVG
jgi:hypothetical protein